MVVAERRWFRSDQITCSMPLLSYLRLSSVCLSLRYYWPFFAEGRADGSISKTINVPEHYPFEDFRSIYWLAYDDGLKGCTTFRPNPITGAILQGGAESIDAPHCCVIEREAD